MERKIKYSIGAIAWSNDNSFNYLLKDRLGVYCSSMTPGGTPYFKQTYAKVIFYEMLNEENIKNQIDYYSKRYNKIQEISNDNIVCWEKLVTVTRDKVVDAEIIDKLKNYYPQERHIFTKDYEEIVEPKFVEYVQNKMFNADGWKNEKQFTVYNENTATIFAPQFHSYYYIEHFIQEDPVVYKLIFNDK
jgi:hypothetical protein